MFNPLPDDFQQALWLRSARQSKGLYVHQLAAKINVNPGRISEWENFKKRIPSEMLIRIKTALKN